MRLADNAPQIVRVLVLSSNPILLNPKSVKRMWPSAPRRTFSGFRSLQGRRYQGPRGQGVKRKRGTVCMCVRGVGWGGGRFQPSAAHSSPGGHDGHTCALHRCCASARPPARSLHHRCEHPPPAALSCHSGAAGRPWGWGVVQSVIETTTQRTPTRPCNSYLEELPACHELHDKVQLQYRGQDVCVCVRGGGGSRLSSQRARHERGSLNGAPVRLDTTYCRQARCQRYLPWMRFGRST